jgi:hypothetical protein
MSDVFHSTIEHTQQQQYDMLHSFIPKNGSLQSYRLALGRLARQAGYTRNKLWRPKPNRDSRVS